MLDGGGNESSLFILMLIVIFAQLKGKFSNTEGVANPFHLFAQRREKSRL